MSATGIRKKHGRAKRGREKPLPDDHPIREIWRQRGLTKYHLAEEGDASAARSLLVLYVHHVRTYKQNLPVGKKYVLGGAIPWELIEWVADRFAMALNKKNDTSLDQVFGLKPGKGTGRKRPRLNSKALQLRLDVANYVSNEMLKEWNLAKASRAAALKFGTSKEKAAAAYRALQKWERL